MSLLASRNRSADASDAAIADAAFCFGSVMLAASFLATLVIDIQRADFAGWPGLLGLAILWCAAAALWAMPQRHGLLAVAAIAILASLVLYAVVVVAADFPNNQSDSAPLSMSKLAVVSFGAVLWRRSRGLLGCTVAYLLAEVTVDVICLLGGEPLALDMSTLVTWMTLTGLFLALRFSRRRGEDADEKVQRAVAETGIDDATLALRLRSAAIVHDTVLNELAVLATTSAGPLSPQLVRQIDRSLELLQRDDRFQPDATAAVLVGSPIVRAVEDAREDGMAVTLSGEQAVAGLLGPQVESELALVIAQCLLNVRSHAKTKTAEVVLLADSDEITVMVIDAGEGFDPSSTGSDRLGLRNSVHGRMAALGGSAQIWASAGNGTSVILTVPRPDVSDGDDGIRQLHG